MPEANPARALQAWFHEMLMQKRQGFRAGTGGEPDGSVLWMYFSRGDAVESRIVFRAGMRDGKPVVVVDKLEGDSFAVLGKMTQPE